MRQKISFYMIILLAITISACKQDEQLIDNSNIKPTLLAARNDQAPKLSLAYYSGEIKTQDVYYDANGKHLESKVERIVPYRGNLYLIMPAIGKIEIISAADFKQVATLDFSASNLKPIDIAFLPNATSAYIVSDTSNIVTLVDLTNFKIARSIACAAPCSDIACKDNQIFVAHASADFVSVIDSRTNKVETTIPVAPHPAYVEISSNEKDVIVISLGNGKLNPSEPKSPAVASFINIGNRTVDAKIDIGYGTAYQPSDQYPRNLATTQGIYAFIGTDKALMRIDTRSKNRISILTKVPYDVTGYDVRYAKLLLSKTIAGASTIVVGDEINASQQSSIKFPDQVTAFCVYAE